VTGRAKQCPEFQKTILWVYILEKSKVARSHKPVGIKGDEPSFSGVLTTVTFAPLLPVFWCVFIYEATGV
jgi:hypothetical protein